MIGLWHPDIQGIEVKRRGLRTIITYGCLGGRATISVG